VGRVSQEHVLAPDTLAVRATNKRLVTQLSGSELSCDEIVLRRHTKSICHAIEKREHRDDIDCLCDLILIPARAAQLFDIRARGFGRCRGDEFCVVEQRSFCGRQPCFIEFALQDCFNASICCPLNTQEVSVAVQSIRTPVQE
jgi:hypothetical protein